MINLLPIKEKEFLLAQYRKRVGVSLLSILAVSMFAGVILLLPTYLFVLIERNATERNIIEADRLLKEEEGGSAEREIAEFNKKLQTLAMKESVGYFPDDILLRISSLRNEGVLIHSVVYKSENFGNIGISGSASNRATLLKFVAALENDEMFDVVDSPISNLVKDENIGFVISATLKSPK